MKTKFATKIAVASVTATILLTGCSTGDFQLDDLVGTASPSTVSSAPSTASEAPEAPATTSVSSASAMKQLNTLKVKDEVVQDDYDREAQFGSDWVDTNNNGCDTRNDILSQDLVNVKYEGPEQCEVVSGVLPVEPYTGATDQKFDADGGYDLGFDTEHIVALENAWQTGARQWTQEKREQFANDTLNLMMTDPSLNRSKGGDNAAEWLPPNEAYHCEYVTQQITIKKTYALWVTADEKATMVGVLETC